MALTQAHCHVLQSSVVRETDLEGRVTRLICPELDAATSSCRLKRSALQAGPLGQLLERITEDSLAERGTQCVLQ